MAAAIQRGGSSLEIADRLGVSDSWVRKLRARLQDEGSVAPLPHGGGREPTIDRAGERLIRRLIASHNDATLAELCELYLADTGYSVSITTMWRALQRLGFSRKKNSSRERA